MLSSIDGSEKTMVVDVFNMEGKKVSTVDLPTAIFEAPVYRDLMHQAFVRQMANAHLGTHDTKVRGEVSGGGHKPWRQKGTGRARQGSIRSAQWKGGGRVHTPHPRSYVQAMPQKMRQSALRSALSVKASEANIIVVDEMKLKEPKTRLMAEALNALVGAASALVLIPQKGTYSYLNVRDLLFFDKLVMPLEALDMIKAHLGQAGG
jgi:large subunit ribosomal protein L4